MSSRRACRRRERVDGPHPVRHVHVGDADEDDGRTLRQPGLHDVQEVDEACAPVGDGREPHRVVRADGDDGAVEGRVGPVGEPVDGGRGAHGLVADELDLAGGAGDGADAAGELARRCEAVARDAPAVREAAADEEEAEGLAVAGAHPGPVDGALHRPAAVVHRRVQQLRWTAEEGRRPRLDGHGYSLTEPIRTCVPQRAGGHWMQGHLDDACIDPSRGRLQARRPPPGGPQRTWSTSASASPV